MSAPPRAVLGKRTMPGAEWFPGAVLNYAENILAKAKPGQINYASSGNGSVAHFAGGFIGKSNREDTPVWHPANAHQVSDTMGDHPGLATPRTCQD